MRVALLACSLIAVVSTGGCLDNLLNLTEERGNPYDYIRDSDYSKWVIEIDYVAGNAPNTNALSTMRSTLAGVVSKDTIETRVTASASLPSDDSWTFDEMEELRQKHQTLFTGGDTVVTYVMYLDGVYAENRNVLGVAWGHDTVALFKDRIRQGCADAILGCPTGKDRTVETAVMIHEMGHILGLVNNGIPMVNDHEGTGDGEHHSSNSNSVMYHQVEGQAVFNLSNIPTTFDANDKADLCSAGGKC